MLIFSELETGTLDLRLDFYGYEDCLPDQFFGPAIRENYGFTISLKVKASLNTRTKKSPFKREIFFYLYPEKSPIILRIIRLLGPTIG